MRTASTIVTCVVFGLMVRAPHAVEGQTYRVGAASVVITPKVAPDAPPVWLAGYGVGRRAEKVHDDVYARAIVVHDGKFGLAIVACDLVGLFYDHTLMIRKQVEALGLEPKIDHVLVSTTHTHAGPDSVGIWGPIGRTGITPGFLKKVRTSCVEAIRKAHAAAKPARLRIATADANQRAKLIKDSRLPVVIDSNMTVIQAIDRQGDTVATLVNIPCHPEVLGSRNPELSSDFPSTMREHIEQKFGGLAIYASGSIGGLLSPNDPKVDPFTKKPMPQNEMDRMMAYGRIMGRIVEDALKDPKPLTGPISVKTQEVLFPVWNQLYRMAMRMGTARRQVYDADGRALEIPLPSPDGKPTTIPSIKEARLKTEVGLIQIGPLQIAAIPGEIYPELTLGRFQQPQEKNADFPGVSLEPAIFPSMTGQYKMVIGLANDEVGYIIPKSQWDWFAPYAYGRKKRQYGEINACDPNVAPMLMAAWAKLIKSE